jgi:hypothetical protein
MRYAGLQLIRTSLLEEFERPAVEFEYVDEDRLKQLRHAWVAAEQARILFELRQLFAYKLVRVKESVKCFRPGARDLYD